VSVMAWLRMLHDPTSGQLDRDPAVVCQNAPGSVVSLPH
jgi:hypothetical protein